MRLRILVILSVADRKGDQTSTRKESGMSHRDKSGCTPPLNAGLLRLAGLWLVRGIKWWSIRWRTDCTWSPRLLAVTALLWAWSDESNLGTRFTASRRIAAVLFPPQGTIASSY